LYSKLGKRLGHESLAPVSRVRSHVLIAAAGKIHDHEIAGLELRQPLDQARKGVRGFQRGDDAFGA